MKQALKGLLGSHLLDGMRRARTFLRFCLGRDVYFRPDEQVPVELLGGRPGDGYGGWFLAPQPLGPQSIVYSLGIGTDISFDLALIKRYGCTIHAFDPTPESQQWLAGQQLPGQLVIHAYGIAARDGQLSFHQASSEGWVSLQQTRYTSPATIALPVKRLATIMQELGHTQLDLLKMDIEGAEYEVLADLLGQNIPCRQLLVEFHHRNLPDGITQTRRTISQLRAAGYQLVKMAANGEEYTFLHSPPPTPPTPSIPNPPKP